MITTESLKAYEKTIKKKHSIAFTPKYQEEFRTNLSERVFIPIVEKTFEKLGWDLVFRDDKNFEAKRKETTLGITQWTEAISVNYYSGIVLVKSESLGNEMWDNGRNSKRVKLFIHAFKETEKEFDKESLETLAIETEKKDNWEDYIIPETLPQPDQTKQPNFGILIIGGLVISLLLGYLLAFVSVKGIYIIGIFELLIALAISVSLKYLIKLTNFTEFKKLQYWLILVILSTYILNQYFQYEIILRENNYDRIGFFNFIKLRLEHGLILKSLNTGWVGLVISWILQLGLTYLFSYLRLISNLTSYQLNRVPTEVIDFAFFHLIKGKTEEETRNELAAKGWDEQVNQDEVFEAIGAIQSANELSRIK